MEIQTDVHAKRQFQLIDVNCQLLQKRPTSDSCPAGDDVDYAALRLTFAETHVTVGSAEGDDFAQLNSSAASVLNRLADQVTLDAYMSRRTFNVLLFRDENADKATLAQFKLNINVLGRRRDSELVGETLSDNYMFLQEPYRRTKGHDYYNPHIWAFDDLSDTDIWLAGLSHASSIGEQTTTDPGWNRVLDDLPKFHSGHTELDVSYLTVPLLKYACLRSII